MQRQVESKIYLHSRDIGPAQQSRFEDGLPDLAKIHLYPPLPSLFQHYTVNSDSLFGVHHDAIDRVSLEELIRLE